MSPPRFEPASLFFRTFAAAGLISLCILSLVDRGATRAYLTPWTGLRWLAQIAPIAALILRLISHHRPFRLPSSGWCAALATASVTILASGLASPYRGPSLLGALTLFAAFATFLLVHDWSRQQPAKTNPQILAAATWFALGICAMSFGQWIWRDLLTSGDLFRVSALLAHRNDHPLGHSNYTAGMALLILPWLGVRLWVARGWPARVGWMLLLLLPAGMLFSSGSRGGMLGFAALVVGSLWWGRLSWRKLGIVTIAALTIATALVYAHPRTRSLLYSPRSSVLLTAASDVQRSAMAHAGARMGADRPVLGWGTAVTPFVYPRYRAGLEGGAENVLQLHSTPVQIWADFGTLGAACAIWFVFIFARRARALRNHRPAGSADDFAGAAVRGAALLALLGYVVFCVTDYQLDVPFFAFAVAACGGLVAAPADEVASRRNRNSLLLATLGSVAIIGIWARPAREPALNVQALALAQDPTRAGEAIALLNESLTINPHQEIAHFNLGWLLLVRDPAKAEQHFLEAAKLVPDKGGVYFGIGLARLNRGQEAAAAQALAVECINDPLFLTSPWWREPALAALHERTLSRLDHLCDEAAALLDARHDRRSRDARYVATLARWIERRASPGEILREAYTSERVSYFAARPAVPAFAESRVRSSHRERSGYPVLMRDMDLIPPVDVFDVRESILATDHLSFLFPAKGWLPSPLLLTFLGKE